VRGGSMVVYSGDHRLREREAVAAFATARQVTA
jgi:hypothetical protein